MDELFKARTVSDDPQLGIEVPALRDEHSKTLCQPDGTMTRIVNPVGRPMHWRNGDRWVPFTLAWQPVTDPTLAAEGFLVESQEGDLRVMMAIDQASGERVRVTAGGLDVIWIPVGETMSLGMVPQATLRASDAGASAVVVDYDPAGTVSSSYTLEPNGLKHDVVLAGFPRADAARSDPFRLTWRMRFSEGAAFTTLDGARLGPGTPVEEFLITGGPADRPLLVRPPIIVDGAGQHFTPDETGAAYVLEEQVGGIGTLHLLVNRGWLAAPERIYPVRIDPTLTLAASTGLSACNPPLGYGSRDNNNVLYTSPYVRDDNSSVSCNWGSAYRFHAFAAFNTVNLNLITGAALNSATIRWRFAQVNNSSGFSAVADQFAGLACTFTAMQNSSRIWLSSSQQMSSYTGGPYTSLITAQIQAGGFPAADYVVSWRANANLLACGNGLLDTSAFQLQLNYSCPANPITPASPVVSITAGAATSTPLTLSTSLPGGTWSISGLGGCNASPPQPGATPASFGNNNSSVTYHFQACNLLCSGTFPATVTYTLGGCSWTRTVNVYVAQPLNPITPTAPSVNLTAGAPSPTSLTLYSSIPGGTWSLAGLGGCNATPPAPGRTVAAYGTNNTSITLHLQACAAVCGGPWTLTVTYTNGSCSWFQNVSVSVAAAPCGTVIAPTSWVPTIQAGSPSVSQLFAISAASGSSAFSGGNCTFTPDPGWPSGLVYSVTNANSASPTLGLTAATTVPPNTYTGTLCFSGASCGCGTAPPTCATVSVTVTGPAACITVSGVSPASGSVGGGSTVTISGSGFSGSGWLAVWFNGSVAANVLVPSDTLLTCEVPAWPGGPLAATVVVAKPCGSATTTYTYAVPAAPTINSVVPGSGPSAGGNVVTINGTNLAGSWTAVWFNGVLASNITAVSSSQITCVPPPHVWGSPLAASLVVGKPWGGASSTYTYVNPTVTTVNGISPGSGSRSGGNPVTITGANLAGGWTAVWFNGRPATNVVVQSNTQLTCTVPAVPGSAVYPLLASVVVGKPWGSGLALYTYY